MEKFIGLQQKMYPVSRSSMLLLLEEVEEITFKKGTRVVSEGKRDYDAYFIKDGFARAFVEREGRDMTLWFAAEGEMLVLTSEIVSSINIELLDDSILYRIPRKRLDMLFEQSLELANWGRKLLEHYIAEYERYFTDYSWIGAQQQYENLLEQHPVLLQKVPLKHIASYLQITPQSLSRIRAKIR